MHDTLNRFTPKQQAFIQEYLIDLNATQSAIRAGYSEKTARQIGEENLSKPDIAKAVHDAMKARSERAELDQDWVLNNWREIAERCLQAKPVIRVVDGEKVETGEWTFNAAGANKAVESVARHLGMFNDKLQLAGDKENPFVVTEITRTIINPGES